MAREPAEIRAITFFDGQNLFRCAKAAFGHVYPNYDPVALSNAVCVSKGWRCAQPPPRDPREKGPEMTHFGHTGLLDKFVPIRFGSTALTANKLYALAIKYSYDPSNLLLEYSSQADPRFSRRVAASRA
jgi:hypothetical protein